MDFLSCFLRNISAFMNCKLNVPEFTFPKENAILLLLSFTSGEGGRFSVKRATEAFFLLCVNVFLRLIPRLTPPPNNLH